MKKIKLLKDWKDPNGQDWTAGTVLEIDDASIVAQLVKDGIAEEVMAEAKKPSISAFNEPKQADINGMVTKAVEQSLKGHKITSVKDLSDEDPMHGYLPAREGDKYSKAEKTLALGMFAHDVSQASIGKTPERLRKSFERSNLMVEKAISKGLVSKAAGTGLQYGVDSDVGYMIPPEINMMLLDVIDEKSIIRPKCTTLSIGAGSVTLPKVKDYDRSSSLLYGGVLAYFKGEDSALTESKPKMEDLELNLSPLTVLAYSSHQAQKFSPIEMGQYLIPKMTSAVVWKEEYSFVNGNGVGMPQGVIGADCTVAIAKESGQTSTANPILTKNIDNMIARLKVENLASVCFLYNRPDLYVWLMNLVRSVGTAGEVARIFTGGLKDAMLSGIPIYDSEHCSAVGTAGDLILADFSQYLIADHRSGAEVAQSMHLKFDYGQNAYRIIKYIDAMPINSSAFTRLKSTNTTSSILTRASL